MTTVAIVYHSGTGTTRIMAEAVHAGASAVPGVESTLHEIVGSDIEEGRYRNDSILEALDAVDGIAFGCPTYMGSVSGQMKSFMDATIQRFYSRTWADKVAAGFSVSATPSGDKLNALTAINLFAMQLGMIWVGLDRTPLNEEGINRLSFYLGAAGQAQYGGSDVAIHEPDRATGEVFGARVARISHALHAGLGAT